MIVISSVQYVLTHSYQREANRSKLTAIVQQLIYRYQLHFDNRVSLTH